MLFDSTRLLVRSVVSSLEKSGESQWDDYLELSMQCLYELHQMARSSSRNYRTDSNPRFPKSAPPHTEGALRAIPAVKLMASAVRRKNREAAIEAGKAAIAELEGTGRSHLLVAATVPIIALVEIKQPALQINGPVKNVKPQKKSAITKPYSAGGKRTAVAKRRPKTRAATANS